MQSNEDKELFERARNNDKAALGELYDRYATRIYSYVLYHVSHEELAEDITAVVFTRMLGAIESSNAWNSSFSGWLYRIAYNAVIDHYRSKDKRETMPLDERLVAAPDDPVAVVEKGMEMEMVRRALDYLTDDQRSVIELKFFEGFTNLEVAKVLDRTEGAIKSLQYRALGALRRHLEIGSGE